MEVFGFVTQYIASAEMPCPESMVPRVTKHLEVTHRSVEEKRGEKLCAAVLVATQGATGARFIWDLPSPKIDPAKQGLEDEFPRKYESFQGLC